MATIQVTNQKASQSLRGQSVTVTLNSSDGLTYLSTLSEGDACVNDSSSFTGEISRVDYYGNSFKITPTMPIGNFSSDGTPGYLAAAETITITT